MMDFLVGGTCKDWKIGACGVVEEVHLVVILSAREGSAVPKKVEKSRFFALLRITSSRLHGFFNSPLSPFYEFRLDYDRL